MLKIIIIVIVILLILGWISELFESILDFLSDIAEYIHIILMSIASIIFIILFSVKGHFFSAIIIDLVAWAIYLFINQWFKEKGEAERREIIRKKTRGREKRNRRK